MARLLIPLNLLIPIAFVAIALIVIMWILYSKNKEMYGKLIIEKKRFFFYKQGVKKILFYPRKNPREDFSELNKLVRDFFREYFNLGYSLTYLELKERFEKQGRIEYAKFCSAMSDYNYSGSDITEEEVKILATYFRDILEKY